MTSMSRGVSAARSSQPVVKHDRELDGKRRRYTVRIWINANRLRLQALIEAIQDNADRQKLWLVGPLVTGGCAFKVIEAFMGIQP